LLDAPASEKLRQAEHLVLLGVAAGVATYAVIKAVKLGPQGVLKGIVGYVMSVASVVPGVRGAIDSQIENSLNGVEKEVLGNGDDETALTLPSSSRTHDEVIELIQKYGVSDSFSEGKSLGGIYYELQGDMSKTHSALWSTFSETNALFPGLFRGVRRMESEVLSMVLSMLVGGSRMAPLLDSLPAAKGTHEEEAATGGGGKATASAASGSAGPASMSSKAREQDEAIRSLPWVRPRPIVPFAEQKPALHGEGLSELCGIVTSGGTESIALAVRGYQVEGELERGIARSDANIVCSQAAHAALDKACHFYGIQLRKIPVNSEMKLCPKKVDAAIDRNTLCVFASAVSFPHGVADDMEALGEVAMRRGVGLHSDNCLGGVLLSSMRGAGIEVPPFDFAVPGVTTMSVDVHKYGNASKGVSVVAYRNR